MANVVIKNWRGNEVVRETVRAMQLRLEKMAEEVAAAVRRNISAPWPPASAPGQFPHSRGGRDGVPALAETIISGPGGKEGEAIVGSTATYAEALEKGTSNMAARPFLVPTLFQFAGRFDKIKVEQ